jgi:hypothetical protein
MLERIDWRMLEQIDWRMLEKIDWRMLENYRIVLSACSTTNALFQTLSSNQSCFSARLALIRIPGS